MIVSSFSNFSLTRKPCLAEAISRKADKKQAQKRRTHYRREADSGF
jgi:hypothetical protein